MSGTIPKHLQPLAKAARKARWSITVTGGCHLRWSSPDGKVFITGMTGHANGFNKDAHRLRKALRQS